MKLPAILLLLILNARKTNPKIQMLSGKRMPLLDDFLFTTNIIQQNTVTSANGCGVECGRNLACVTLAFNGDSRICTLYDVMFWNVNDAIPQSGTRHFSFGNEDVCPQSRGYVHFWSVNACHAPFTTRISWTHAQVACAAQGGHLSKFEDMEEMEKVFSIIRANSFSPKTFYFGAGIDNPESGWAWRDGTPVTLSQWGPGEPQGNGNCVYISCKTAHPKCFWNDMRCDSFLPYFICEIDLP